MKVIAFTTELDISRGGKQRSMLDICRGLAERGHVIDLLFLQDGDLYSAYAQFCRQCLQVKTYDIAKQPLVTSVFHFWQSLWSAAYQLCFSKPDSTETVIYIDDHRLGLFAYALGRWCQWPVIFHVRQPVLNSMPRKYGWPLRRLQKFIAVSEQIKQEWGQVDLDWNKISVVYNGIDTNYFVPVNHTLPYKETEYSQGCRVVTYLGRLDPEKGLETFINAIAILRNQRPTMSLRALIVGRPVLHISDSAGAKYVESLQDLVASLDLQHVLEFKPFIDQPLSIYHLSDLTVLPSIYPEPFGRTLIESMACGTPTLGSCIGGIPEILTGEFQSLLFEPGNAEALAQRFQSFIDWRDTDPGLGDRCRQHVAQNFSLSKTIEQVEGILSSVVST